MTPAQYNEYQRQADVIEQHERWKAEQEKIKQLAEQSWEGCHGCDENDKNMWMNGFIKAYLYAKADLYTEEHIKKAFEAGHTLGVYLADHKHDEMYQEFLKTLKK